MLLGPSPRRIDSRAKTVVWGMLAPEASVRSVRLALSLTQIVRAASGATLGLRAVMVPAAPALMERR